MCLLYHKENLLINLRNLQYVSGLLFPPFKIGDGAGGKPGEPIVYIIAPPTGLYAIIHCCSTI